MLAIADGRHIHPCSQKLADSVEPRTEWALQSNRVNLIGAPGSQPPTGHELLKVSRLANVMMGLVMGDTSLVAVIRSLVQYGKTFELSYDASFDEACISNVCKDHVSSGYLQGAVEATYRRYVRVARLVRRYPEAV